MFCFKGLLTVSSLQTSHELSLKSLNNYLKIAAQLDICEFDGKKEKSKHALKKKAANCNFIITNFYH